MRPLLLKSDGVFAEARKRFGKLDGIHVSCLDCAMSMTRVDTTYFFFMMKMG